MNCGRWSSFFSHAFFGLLLTVGASAADLESANLTQSLELDFRHQANRSLPDDFQQSAVLDSAHSWGGLTAGMRWTEETVALDRVSYFGEARYAPFSFLQFTARLLQTTRIEDQSGTTTLMANVRLCTPFTSVSFCMAFGPLHRAWQMDKRAWLPFAYRTSISERDWVVRLDLNIRWSDGWKSELVLGTFENMEVYHLHNPYLQLMVSTSRLLENADVFMFGRYHVLLGFAIVDNWTTGLGMRMRI